ncbi:MAG: MerR family transcriptional regulator [Bacteroides sp.]|nr:MerR family transcriptional regulator [Eubacterium sp.]MCM1417609.1 MerR family transcriptional regulator [Roseburia sp.]MCM1461680.1 MerR family transcriptional regulator [Bacteroides sp.]
MTLSEASEYSHIGEETLREYEESGLLGHDRFGGEALGSTEADLRRIGLIGFLRKAGFEREALKSYLTFVDEGNTDEQIRMLKKRRYGLLDEIHEKQRLLDELDYMIRQAGK